jgi:transposase-like protein
MMNEVKTLTDAIRYFSDEQVCIDVVAEMRWPDGPVCPKCASGSHRQHWLKIQKRWQCRNCGKQFSVKAGTIFEDSAIRLDKWLVAMWLLANCKNGISSYELARDIGVTQKSAWFLLHRIREALRTGTVVKMGNTGTPVQADETFIGGKPKNMHRDRRLKMKIAENGYAEKTAIFGMLETGSRQVRAMVVPNVKRTTLQKAILDNVGFGSTVHTDNWPGYDGLRGAQFVHDTVNHMTEHVSASGVHTQAIENFWSCLKRTLNGTYVAVEPFHMDRYVTEQCFRFNNRTTKANPLHDGDRFMLAVSQISGKRLTYAELTGKVGNPQV